MKLFTQIVILIGFVITMVNVTAESDEPNRLLDSDKMLYLTPLQPWNPSGMEIFIGSDYLVIPDGEHKGAIISKQKLKTAIAEQFEDIVEVDDISIVDEFYLLEGLYRLFSLGFVNTDMLNTSFRVTTKESSDTGFYPYVQCATSIYKTQLVLDFCDSMNEYIFLGDSVQIPISDINVSVEEYRNSK